MSLVNTPSGLTDRQMAVIRQCAQDGKDWKSTYKRICEIKQVTQKLVREQMELYSAEIAARSTAKKEGAALIDQYLANIKDGADVDDMTALIEQALYRDILRRYSEADNALAHMTMGEVLKLDIAYRGARLNRLKFEKDTIKNDPQLDQYSASLVLETLDQVQTLANGALDSEIDDVRELIIEWANKKYGKTTIEEVKNERNQIEQLRELHQRQSSRNDSEAEPGYGKSVGLVD